MAAWQEHFSRPAFEPGDRVRLVGQPWSRYVRSLEPWPASLDIPPIQARPKPPRRSDVG